MEEKINEPEKEKKSDINYSLYAENPEKLFPIAQEQFNKNNFEEGIDILEQSILLAVKKFGGEEKIELVQFYHKYADGILQKLLYSNNDILNVQEDEEIGSKNKEEEPKEEKEKDKEKDKEKEKEKEKNIEEEKVQKQGDFKNDKKEGKGVYYYKNGDREMGNYLNGKEIGKHVKLHADGSITSKVY